MKCLIIGGDGQLGRALQMTAPASATVIASTKTECDLTNAVRVSALIEGIRPSLIFNTAAYTAVDAAESDAATANLVNSTSVGHLAEVAKRYGARLIQVSTDYVFDGDASTPYRPDDETNPISVYGRSKLGGELAIAEVGGEMLIVRTSWLYAENGKNFLRTMLRLMDERDELRVVDDQFGTPTYAGNLATALWELATKSSSGIFHFTDCGVASWYDFAVAIQEEALDLEILKRTAAIIPIPTSQYPTPARRPRFSVLDKSKTWTTLGRTGQHWRQALRENLKKAGANE